MRVVAAIVVLCGTLILGACSVVGLAADAASVAGTVVTTTVSTAGDVVDAAAHTVAGSSNEPKKLH